MSLFESQNQEAIHQILSEIQTQLVQVLNGEQIEYQGFYRNIYQMHQNQHGILVQNLTTSKITQVFSEKIKSIEKGKQSLGAIYATLKQMTEVVDKLMKLYFYFEEMYYEAERQTSLKIVAYNIIKELLVKEESVFVEFLSQLSILMFKVKNNESVVGEKDQELMVRTLELIHNLDKYPGKILIFNHFLKDLYIKNMTSDNRSKIQKFKNNYNPKLYFSTMRALYQQQQRFVNKYLKSKKTELTINDIIRGFYSNWISQNWSFLFTMSPLLQQTLTSDFLVIYNAIKLDDLGLKQFTIWFNQLLLQKLKNLQIVNNETLIQEFSELYRATHQSMSGECDNLFVAKVKITFENWLNNDSIDIPNRLNTYIHSLIVSSFEDQVPTEVFQGKLENPMIVFKFTKDKDLFELAYAKGLLERMVSFRYSRVLEELTLKPMKEECGESWTSRIEAIISENSETFKLQSPIEDKNNIITINQLHWFTLTSKEPFVNDKSMIEFQSNIGSLSDKETKWLLNYGNGLLRMHLGKSFNLRVSTRGMQLLSYFNTHQELKLKEYLKQTQYDIGVLKGSINCLVKSNILLANPPVTDLSSIKNDLILTLNLGYNPQAETMSVFQQKQNEILTLAKKQQLTEDRKLIIEAIITKLMKQLKVGQKDQIIESTLRIIDQKGFSASKTLVQNCLTPLQDRGYIQIVSNSITYLP